MAAGGRAVFELAPTGAAGEDIVAPEREVDWMCRLAGEIGMPVSFALLQVNAAPTLWRELMDRSLAATDTGAPVFPQVAAPPLRGHDRVPDPPRLQPSGRPTGTWPRRLGFDDLAVELARPEVRRAILSETDLPEGHRRCSSTAWTARSSAPSTGLYVLGDPPDYEPTPDRTVTALAAARGVDPMTQLYDLLLEQDGRALLMLPFFNYADGNHDAIRDMLTHPAGVSGLSDGGAHCGMICDASMPTYLLTHWARDRARGERLPLEYVVRKQTSDTAALYGLGDRGVIEVGKKGDLNVIDLPRLALRPPRMAHDLPAGGRRLLQDADGYVATIVSGQVTRRDGKDTGARPGRLVRGAR